MEPLSFARNALARGVELERDVATLLGREAGVRAARELDAVSHWILERLERTTRTEEAEAWVFACVVTSWAGRADGCQLELALDSGDEPPTSTDTDEAHVPTVLSRAARTVDAETLLAAAALICAAACERLDPEAFECAGREVALLVRGSAGTLEI